MQDRTIQYYTITHITEYHTSHKIIYNTHGNPQYAKLRDKIRNTYYTLLKLRNK